MLPNPFSLDEILLHALSWCYEHVLGSALRWSELPGKTKHAPLGHQYYNFVGRLG